MTDTKTELHRQAEEKATRLHRKMDTQSQEDILQTIYELMVYHIELERRNAELQQTTAELQKAHDHLANRAAARREERWNNNLMVSRL
jgi:succinate dehydrogenase/fumarate reductase flavoprotein subunit